MLMTYKECICKWQNDYQIKKRLKNKELYQIEKGIYSDVPDHSELEIISRKYPEAIVTMESAFYYHGLTETASEKYCLATDTHSVSLEDKRVRQYYIPTEILNKGVTVMKRDGAEFKIYGKERMLIEFLRYKNKFPFDYYKEIMGNYRDIIRTLDMESIWEYAKTFPKHNKITEAFMMEVL